MLKSIIIAVVVIVVLIVVARPSNKEEVLTDGDYVARIKWSKEEKKYVGKIDGHEELGDFGTKALGETFANFHNIVKKLNKQAESK